MNIEDIEDGAVYRLTQDLANPKPDRRSRDTLAQECIPKGTTFVGDVFTHDEGEPNTWVERKLRVIFTYEDVRCPPRDGPAKTTVILAHLERVPDGDPVAWALRLVHKYACGVDRHQWSLYHKLHAIAKYAPDIRGQVEAALLADKDAPDEE